MDTNQERIGDLLNNKSPSGSVQSDYQPGERIGDMLAAKPQAQRRTQERDYQAPGGNFDDLIAQEGADAIKPVIQAIYAQESGSGKNARTSIDGARGGMQVIPATFARFARPGEDINNPDDAVRVGIRYAKYLGDKFGNDPAKIAAGYFSGEGNVNSGQGSAWKNDRADGNGKSVSGYVSDVMKRIGQMPAGEKKDASAPLPDLNNIPKWGEIAGSARFKGLDSAKQAEVKGQYFDEVIAPHAKASGANVDQVRKQFMAQPNAKPGMLDKAWEATKDVAGRLATNPFASTPSVMEGYKGESRSLPTDSKAPVRPEVRAQFNAEWDAATPDKRAAMAQREDWIGQLARERSGVFDRNDAAVGDSKTARSVDPRVEARRSQLIAAGEDPRFADVAATQAAKAGVFPGAEVPFMQKGVTAQNSNFDFDTNKAFNQTNGLNNPLTRGLAKAGIGLTKATVGFDQFLADMVGADEAAKAMKGYGDTLRGKESAIGERGSFMERNLEGAINSIGQQLPLRITGMKLESEAIPLAGIGVTTFGQEYSDGRSKGLSPAQASARAGIFAAFEVIGEKFGLKEQMQGLKAAARRMPTDQIASFFVSALKKELPGEMLTTTGQFATDKFGPGGIALNPNATGGDYLTQMGDTIAQTIMQSMLMGGGTAGVSKAAQFMQNKGESERLYDIRAENARQSALDAWNTRGFSQPARQQQSANVTPDGRIEPSLNGAEPIAPAEPAGAPAVHPLVETADNIVREAAQVAGIPADAVMPQQTDGGFSDEDVIGFAQSRIQELTQKRDGTVVPVVGETGIVNQDMPGVGLTPDEQRELDILQRAGTNPQALRSFYKFDQSQIQSDQSQFATQANQPAPAAGVAEQPAVGQQFPAATDPGLVAAQENQNVQVQGQDQANGPAPSTGAVRTDGIASGPAAQQEPAAQAAAAQADGSNGGRVAGQQDGTVQPQGALLTDEQAQAINGWLDSIGETDPAVRQQVMQQAATNPQAREQFLSQAEAAAERQAIQSEQAAPVEQQAIPLPEEAAGSSVNPFEPAKQPAKTSTPAFTRKEIPAMTNEELVEAQKYYSDRGHKRAAKIEKEINKRAKEMSNGTQAEEAKPAEAGQQAQPVQPADVNPNLADEPRHDQSTQVADESTPFTKESAPVVDETDAELNDALAHLGEVLSDVFQPKAGIVANKYGAGDLLPALSKVVELLVRKGFKSFAEATAKAAGAMRGNEKTAPFVNSISARQWKAAYNAVAEFHEGTDDEAAVSAISNDDVLAIVRGKPATEKAASAKPYLFTPEGKFAIAKEVADFFIGGGEFKSIVDARKKISDLTGQQINAGTEAAKQADEAIETAVVLAGREMVQAGRKQGRSSAVIFNRLLSLYNAQPNLAVRSSTSMRDQAYSTPVPLAYVASELAGITYETKVLEPTAGNGMLLVGAATGKATANELNPKRAAMLDAIGFKAKTDNAATGTLAQAKSQDAVIANPPFGVTKDENGNTIIYDVTPTYGTREVDHAIVFKSLETMKDDGRAVLIVGGVQAEGDEARREDYRGKSKRTFYFNLYDKYNVVDHFSINGDMYSKQGASYPVDVIVIQGRGKSARDLPAADLPKVINSYDELKEKLNEAGRVGTAGNVGTNGTVGSESASRAGDGTGMAGSTGQPGNGTGDQGKRQSVPVRDVQRDGSADGKQSAPGRASDATGQLGSSDATQLRSDRSEPVSGDSNGKRPGRRGSDQRNGSVDVGGSGGIDGQRIESGLADRRGQEQETETQVAYTPHSQAASVGTLVPRAMKDSIQESIKKIEDQFGNVDEFVADALQLDPESLRSNFSAEQVDALALAIKNAQEGRGFIIGDQTGIGKGRVVAAMIKYALVNGKVPIFVTEKPNLYSDMIRDLDDIGMAEELGLDTKKSKILITNRDESIPYSIIRTNGDEVTETNFTLKAPKSSKDALEKLFSGMRESNSLGDYKVIFTTYSQLQTVKGKKTERMNFIEHFGAGNYMIFDESHNAGGAGETQARTREQRQAAKNGESLVTGRAAFVRGLVNKAFGTFFSSATYAKRPDVMDLYSSTNMKLAVDKISELGEAIKQGGVPMQQIVATMLTKDGQYIRRERTFAGVSYDTTETKVDKKTAENMASAMRSILRFSRAKEAAIEAMQKEMDKQGGMVSVVGGEKTSVQGANFGSSMHNLIDQMLLSLKSKSSVDHAIERLKAGEKVVMTVSNTMGSFLKDYADEMELASGDVVSMSFADLYKRYLEKQRIVTIKRPNGQTEKYRLTDEDLGSSLSQMFREIGKQIDSAGFGEAPISPIDYMHAKLREAGYKTDEITGRTLALNYDSGEPKLAGRKADIKHRVNAVRGFNNGDTDVLILNQAGSTGLSLHASSKFKDQRKRHMIIVQAEKNIDTHMQMLGRVHRTGQIVAPAYSQMMADIPAEMRPAAVLLKKMASLNANTTASRKSSVTAEGVVDFMNDYGGQVVQEYLRDNREVHSAIGGQGVIKLTDDSSEASEDDIRKFTGYIPILPIKQQEEIYKDLIDRYNELLERENSLGTNKLEAKAVDLDADTVSSQPITEDKGDPSIFATPAFMERVDVKRTVKPYSSAEVADMVTKRLDGKRDMVVALEMSKDMSASTDAYIKATVEKMEASDKADPVRINEFKTQTEATARHVDTVLKAYPIGTSISVTDRDGATLYGIVTDVVNSGRTANPSAPSSWKMHVALANGDAKAITLSFSQVGGRYTLAVERNVNWYNAETQKSEFLPVASLFDKGATVRREKRWIVTGNILAGYAKHSGQIITYTKKDGSTGQGVLMSRQFDYAQAKASERVRIKTGDDAVRFLDGSNGAMVGTDDNVLKISKRGHLYMVSVPSSKKEGGTFFLDQQLTEAMGGDFYKRGSVMSATLYYSTNVRDLVDYLVRQREEKVVALTNLDKAREMFNPAGVSLADIGRGKKALPETIKVDGKDRPTKNSNGKSIAQTEEGVRNFWRWFSDSKVVDDQGRPLVVYHGTTADLKNFDPNKLGSATGAASAKTGFFFALSPLVASGYATLGRSREIANLEELHASELERFHSDQKKGVKWTSQQLSEYEQRFKKISAMKRAVELARRVAEIEFEDATSKLSAAYLFGNEEERKHEYEQADEIEKGNIDAYQIAKRKLFASTVSDGANVGSFYLKIDNPVEKDYEGDMFRDVSYFQISRGAKLSGNDGVIFLNTHDMVRSDYDEKTNIFVAFSPTQIKSATGNSGEFDPSNPSILANISRTLSPAPAFTNAKMNRQIDKLNKAVEEGRMTDAEFRLAVKEMRQSLKDANDDKKVDAYSKERRNGAEWIIAKLLRGVADGTIPRGEADFAEWALNQNPRIADRLTISVTEADGKSARGEYFPYLQMIKLYASNLSEDQGDHGTAVHEILHHAERMMPVDVQAGILDEWQRQWDAEYKKSSPEVKAAMRDMLAASFGNAEAKDRVVKAFNNGLLNYDQHYQFYSPSEFWTVNATAILNNRYEARGSWVKRVQQWFREFIERLKGLVGAQSDTPVLNALRDLMETDGNPKSSKMIQERDYSMWLNEKDVDAENDGAEISHQDIVRNMRNKAIQFFGNQDLNTFNWYYKSIATQYHKALKDKHFGKVFSLLLDMQNHVSLAANRAAERAPGVLPMVDDLKAAVKGLVSKQNQAAMDKASQMLFAGTLAGGNVLEGKVWTNAEMRNQFGADDAAIEFYRQSREAIDSMLDEMAATEAFVLAKPMISGNKEIRGSIIENPKDASGLIESELAKKIKMFEAAAKQARGRGDEAMAESMENAAKEHNDALRKVKKIFKHATDLKMAGYMPLKRFGKYDVTAKLVDPITGQTMRNEDGEPSTLFYGRFDTQAEARKAEAALRERYAGQDDVSIKIGAHNSERNELYSGVDLDALQLFADAIGEKRVTDEYIRAVRSERSVLKHLLERKGTPGFSTDIQRVLAAYLTAGARHAAQQLYSTDVAYAIKHIPSEKGDVQREAQSLRDFVMNQKDPGAVLSSVMFLWFISMSPAAVVLNLTQPVLVSLPVLSIQAGGEGKAIAALAKAYKMALGKAEYPKELREAMRKASLGGIVDAQEIFHIYSQASRQVGGTTKAQSAMAIMSFMFSAAEKLNRRVTFIAAYNIAKQTGHPDPYGYAVEAVNSTQGIYNKVNRPNAARSLLGRAVFIYKTFPIMVGELMIRLAKNHGPAGKRALGVMLAMLFIVSGEEGLPGAKFLDDLIDTIGQWLGYDTNAKRFKRRHAYEILGRFWGDFAISGVSSMLPLDFGGRIGMGNMIPGTEILKPSSGVFNIRSLAEIAGPTMGAAKQVGDFSEAAAEGNYGKALANLSPKFIRDILGGFEMAAKGHATNTLGQKTVNTTGLDAAVKAIGFNPTVVASDSREKMPIRQDERLRSAKAASFAGQLSQAMIDRDGEAARKIGEKLKAWNEKNPDTRINVADVARSARERTKKAMMDSDQRTMKTAPKSMRGRVSSDLGL